MCTRTRTYNVPLKVPGTPPLQYTNYFTLPMCFLCINAALYNFKASNRDLKSYIAHTSLPEYHLLVV